MKLSKDEISSLIALISEGDNINKYSLSTVLDKLKSNTNTHTMYVDGAADLHSKTAGIGGVIYKGNEELITFSEYLDDSTNNEAEYESLIHGLKLLVNLSILNVNIFSDSELVVRQINGEYKVKNVRMKKLYQKATSLLSGFENWTFTHVLRDKNKVADMLATEGRLKGK
tara:strand:- start:2531 stop:3040 length:510 start_codon:yes stop_codon:yes gene_type:complete